MKTRPIPTPLPQRIHIPQPPSGASLHYEPKSETGRIGQALLEWTLAVIDHHKPAVFVIENPRALMRKMPQLQHLERRTVTYCQYGMPYMKPTDLWGGFPRTLKLLPPCNNGDPCHESAPRGAKTGVQGVPGDVAAKIPNALAAIVAVHAIAQTHSLQILDLFCGHKGWSEPYLPETVTTLDFDPRFNPTICADALTLAPDDPRLGNPSVILASPPCESFSVGSFRHHWRATSVCRCGEPIERVSGEAWEHYA